MKGSSFCEKVSLDPEATLILWILEQKRMFLSIKNRLQVLDILYQYHRCCLILEWQIHSPVWKISYPLNTGFLPSTELQSSKELPTTSSLHNPTKLLKSAPKKKKRQTNLHETFIQSHLSVSRLPSFHHETTLSCPSSKPPLPIKIRRGKWRNLAVVSLKRRTNFRTKISPTKK